MLGQAISAQTIGRAGLRELASEYGGPRPAGTAAAARAAAAKEPRTGQATRP